MGNRPQEPKDRILREACKIFADKGYSGASIQDIVDAAGVTKPTLYYYFGNKAGLFQALLDLAADERYRLMQAAVEQHDSLERQLIAVTGALLRFAQKRPELLRIMFSFWFGSKGEIPREIHCEKGMRNYQFIHSLIARGLKSGRLDARFRSAELASGLSAQIFMHSLGGIARYKGRYKKVSPDTIVKLFLEGAKAR